MVVKVFAMPASKIQSTTAGALTSVMGTDGLVAVKGKQLAACGFSAACPLLVYSDVAHNVPPDGNTETTLVQLATPCGFSPTCPSIAMAGISVDRLHVTM